MENASMPENSRCKNDCKMSLYVNLYRNKVISTLKKFGDKRFIKIVAYMPYVMQGNVTPENWNFKSCIIK